MTTQIETLHALFKALKNKLPYKPENDEAHDLIDRGIEVCQAVSEVESDTAMAFLKTQYTDIKNALVSGVLIKSSWMRIGIPWRQPVSQQIDWARNKGGERIEITIFFLEDGKYKIQEFDLNRYFQK